ncbi:hypothetical protein ACFPPA_03205 [Rhodanobacter ginsengisoli]|uniref:Uncharacterized protein n=1 Tax=Rhodanobacter ginsengisoli TaxID=418646 RepID=A0ABW0QJ13_9GAMM
MLDQRNLPTVVADESAGKPELKENGDTFVGRREHAFETQPDGSGFDVGRFVLYRCRERNARHSRRSRRSGDRHSAKQPGSGFVTGAR